MICTWRDRRPVWTGCALCGALVQTTVQVRGVIYCPACREQRRRETTRSANRRFRQKRVPARTDNGNLVTPRSELQPNRFSGQSNR
jgi:ribosome-binding protein aMBF1 (putative translation factor)